MKKEEFEKFEKQQREYLALFMELEYGIMYLGDGVWQCVHCGDYLIGVDIVMDHKCNEYY